MLGVLLGLLLGVLVWRLLLALASHPAVELASLASR